MKKNPKNPELRAEAIKAGKRIEELLPKLWAEAKNALLNVGQAAAKPSSKPNENKEIQDIAKIITEDIRTNNGIILENQWDVPFPQPNFRSAVFREFFEFLEQKGINPPENLNSLVSEFLGIKKTAEEWAKLPYYDEIHEGRATRSRRRRVPL